MFVQLGSMAKLTQVAEKGTGAVGTHITLLMSFLSSDLKGGFHVCCLLSAQSPISCGLRLVGVNVNKTGEQKGMDLISSGS